jgi:hypothetical protein
MDRNIENVLAGCFIAICSAIGAERTEIALSTLSAFIDDCRTPDYERQAYQDLIDCLALELSTAHDAPVGWLAQLGTVH